MEHTIPRYEGQNLTFNKSSMILAIIFFILNLKWNHAYHRVPPHITSNIKIKPHIPFTA